MIEKVFTDRAPTPIGPYSQDVASNGFVFCAGQIGLDPKSGRLVDGDISAQTRQALENLFAVLDAANAEGLVFVNIYTIDISQFGAINEVYEDFLKSKGIEPFPARAVVEVSSLPAGASVEIAAVAVE